jgi:hypothetical protein
MKQQPMTEREQEISYWFSDQSDCFIAVQDIPIEGRFYQAFKTVLSQLTEEQFEKFMEREPILLFFPGTKGRAFQWRFPVPDGVQEARKTFLYISPDAGAGLTRLSSTPSVMKSHTSSSVILICGHQTKSTAITRMKKQPMP